MPCLVSRRRLVLGLAAPFLLACGEDPPLSVPTDPGGGTGLPAVPAAQEAWIQENAHPLGGVTIDLPSTELGFLRDRVADARIVALGENTHGAREFFQAKGRTVRYLVEEMGFDGFAIEASWPEANRLDRYVRTGEGDPRTLLSGLYFWTWNTEEVLALVEWMRAHNAAGGDVGFYGFDMPYPGMALHTVLELVETVDPDALPGFTERLACLARYANGPHGDFPDGRYGDEPGSLEPACAALPGRRRGGAPGRSSRVRGRGGTRGLRPGPPEPRRRPPVRGGPVRDQEPGPVHGRERRVAGRGAGAVVPAGAVAHNAHLSTRAGSMGSYLRAAYGDGMVIMGFTHSRGSFTAVELSEDGYGPRGTFTLDPVRASSFEHYMDHGPAQPFVLDLRAFDPQAPGTLWLANPWWTRSIGCCYDPRRPEIFWERRIVSGLYDLLLHVPETSPSRVLPFVPPDVF